MKIDDDIMFYIRSAAAHAEIWRNPTPDQLDAIVTALVLALVQIQRHPDGMASYDRVRRLIAERVAAAAQRPS